MKDNTPAINLPGAVSKTSWQLPANLSQEDWHLCGKLLCKIEGSVQWWIGDWWATGAGKWNGREVTEAEDWEGPTYQTCMDNAWIAAKFEFSRRRENLTFAHHREVAALSPHDVQDAWLDIAEAEGLSAKELRLRIKQSKRTEREKSLGVRQASLPDKKYGVIVADPEWRFEPWSRETGMDRAADNHYPTSVIEVIAARNVQSIADKDCVLFLWATVPMLPHALLVMEAWGFDYKSSYVWGKDYAGTGYWNRNKHECLLIGVCGDIPCPAPGMQWESLIMAPVASHSAKPECFLEMIEQYFPHLTKIELNRRGSARNGWDAWGNEFDEAAE